MAEEQNTTTNEQQVKYFAPLTFFKTKSTIRFSPLRTNVRENEKGSLNVLPTAIMLDIANSNEDKTVDWNNKITMKLGPVDLVEILTIKKGLPKGTECVKLVHVFEKTDPETGEVVSTQTNLVVTALGEHSKTGKEGFSFSVFKGDQKVSAVLNESELFTLRQSILSIWAQIIGWAEI